MRVFTKYLVALSTQVADFLVSDTYLEVALESTRHLLVEMQVSHSNQN